jgi:uncharacterized membrane protein SpoIIM required for sporulation
LIIDLERFIAEEKPCWDELEGMLERMERDVAYSMDLAGVQRFHYLYQRASAALARIDGFAAAPEFRRYLESLVARSFGEIHETRQRPHRFAPRAWFFGTFPRTFRRHIRKFQLSVAITIIGCLFGGAALLLDPADKEVLLPFQHLIGSPAERVAREEKGVNKRLEEGKLTFSSYLMTHNTQVSIACMASGLTFGIGTLLLLFFNGVILGAVVVDYVAAGQSLFLAGWLLPHGVVEIPAILLAGQGGLILASALIGRESGLPLAGRLRLVWGDLVTLMGGVGIMLVWAGLVEALFSQYHEPVLPYPVKIGFGLAELLLLVLFLARAGAVADGGGKGPGNSGRRGSDV